MHSFCPSQSLDTILSHMKRMKLREFKQHRFYKYLLSFIIVVAATFIQKALWEYITPAPFLVYYLAIIFASMYGDGISAVLMSLIASQYYFVHPFERFEIIFPQDYLRLLIFAISGFIARKLVNNLMLAKLEAENAVKSLENEKELRETFVSALTHDLQTPLTAMRMSTELLIRKKDDSEAFDKFSEKILFNMTRIEHMVRDLLDANKIRAGKTLPVELEEVDICECIRETVNELVGIHGPRFQTIMPPTLTGRWSKKYIRRILENLCQNAVKYGHDTNPITITLSAETKGVILTVHNTGRPIPPDDLPLLFNPFERSKTGHASGKQGWGLGLTLVRGLAEAMGGSVRVTSDAVNGTNFIVFLPYH